MNIHHRCQPSFDCSDCINLVSNLLHNLAHCGFVLCGILDGDIRPDCTARAEMASINSFFAVSLLSVLALHLMNSIRVPTKRKKLEILNKEAKKLDSASFCRTDFGVFLGPNAFILRSVNYSTKNKDNNTLSFEISGYCNKLMSNLKKFLIRKNIGWKPAKFPVLGFPDPILRLSQE